jgi:hypothetical protein
MTAMRKFNLTTDCMAVASEPSQLGIGNLVQIQLIEHLQTVYVNSYKHGNSVKPLGSMCPI